MADKQRLSKADADTAIQLDIVIPEYHAPSHPFSRGNKVEIYTPEGLKKIPMSNSERTNWFLKHLCTIYEIIESPVPFVFRESSGDLRSLDAGCVGYLVNTSEPCLALNVGPDGFISSVIPTAKGSELSAPKIASLMSSMSSRSE